MATDLGRMPSEAMFLLGVACAREAVCFRDLQEFCRSQPSETLRWIAKYIADNEFDLMWAVNCLELELGLSELEITKGPSFWVTDVLPAIKAELERRSRPKGAYTGNSPIARLKQLDLATVAGRHTQLKRAGPGKLKGRCPLHDERTPSFYVYEDSQRWRCFGACATGGDVINLLQRLRARERSTV